jgi:hypothetical protein
MTVHEEVPIKVTAWVDKGVAPLVEALNAWDGVVTLDSCEGYDGESARVTFTSRHDADELFTLMKRLASVFNARFHSEGVTLRLEWHAGAEQPVADLLVSRPCLGAVAEALLASA